MPAVLTTSRLRLTPIAVGDGPWLAELYGDPEVARYIGGADLDAQQQCERFAEIWRVHGFGQSWVHRRGDGARLGRAGLHVWPEWDEVEVGYVLARPYWGHGYATEAAAAWLAHAFERLGLRRVTSVIHPDNVASRRVAERFGMTRDRRDVTPRGVTVDVYACER